jgi:histidine ammonia-lyase
MPEPVVRLILLLKAASLARGFSGVREEVIDTLLALHNKGLTPVIPCQGSVGASGDLAPLAHLSLPLVGEGEVFYQGERMPAAHALDRAGIRPIQLSAKEAWR